MVLLLAKRCAVWQKRSYIFFSHQNSYHRGDAERVIVMDGDSQYLARCCRRLHYHHCC